MHDVNSTHTRLYFRLLRFIDQPAKFLICVQGPNITDYKKVAGAGALLSKLIRRKEGKLYIVVGPKVVTERTS